MSVSAQDYYAMVKFITSLTDPQGTRDLSQDGHRTTTHEFFPCTYIVFMPAAFCNR